METLFILLFICSNFLHKGQVTRYFDVWFVVSLYKLFNIQWSGRLFETPWRSCDVHVIKCQQCLMTFHYCDVIMSAVASQITSLTIVYSDTDQRKHQSSASLTFARGIHRSPVNLPHKWPVMRNVSISWRHHVPKSHMGKDTISYHTISYISNLINLL